ncbi:hypothetical protein TNCV_4085321 [Trichonephila clavipes]|nr:hypothetical protein TNCV_4085321 [Trichonephila clavipes]
MYIHALQDALLTGDKQSLHSIAFSQRTNSAHLIEDETFNDSDCKEPLPAPGNRSNERRYRGKDLARTEEKKVGTGRERAVAKKTGLVKNRDD